MHEAEERSLKKKLEIISRSGVCLFLEGQPATPEQIADCCVCEESVYMADYVMDETGTLKELRYDRVTHWK